MMDNGQSTLTTSSTVTKFKNRPPPKWVPCAGTKRKAHIANLGDNFDSECRPSPAKQFAVDEEVAGEILCDGFYYDPSIPPMTNENQVPNEVEMDEEQVINDADGVFVKAPGDITNCACAHSSTSSSRDSMSEKVIVDEKECRDDSVIKPHSMHESQPISPSKFDYNKAESLVMNGLSLVLSNEIQETLIRRKLNEDFILPKSIMNQVCGANTSMALVPWKPPVKIESLIVKDVQPKPAEKSVSKNVMFCPQNLDPDILTHSTSIPLSIQQLPSSSPESILLEASEDGTESMDVDISL